MNLTQEPWFNDLPYSTQQDLLYKQQIGQLNDNDINKLKFIYTPKPKRPVKPMNSIERFGYGIPSAMANVGNKGGNIVDVLKAGAEGATEITGDIIKKIHSSILLPFFNCFKEKLTNSPISSIDDTSDINLSYAQLYSIYSFCSYLFIKKESSKNISDPKFNGVILPIIKDTYGFDNEITTISENIWSNGLPDNMTLTLLNKVADLLKLSINQIQEHFDLQSNRLLNPGLRTMFDQIFTEEYIPTILSAFNNTNELSKLGIVNDNGNLTINNITGTMQNIQARLRSFELKARNICLSQIKDTVMGDNTNEVQESIYIPFDSLIKEVASQFGNPALDTLNNQTKPKSTLTPNTPPPQASAETNSTLSPTTSGFGGLGSAEAGQQKFYDILGQAGSKYGLDSTALNKMGFGGQQEESPAAKLGMPKDQHDSFNKWFGPALKEFMKNNPAPTQSSTENIDDLLSGISQ